MQHAEDYLVPAAAPEGVWTARVASSGKTTLDGDLHTAGRIELAAELHRAGL
jgi:hypothetical protein